jgi:hypothetical protein
VQRDPVRVDGRSWLPAIRELIGDQAEHEGAADEIGSVRIVCEGSDQFSVGAVPQDSIGDDNRGSPPAWSDVRRDIENDGNPAGIDEHVSAQVAVHELGVARLVRQTQEQLVEQFTGRAGQRELLFFPRDAVGDSPTVSPASKYTFVISTRLLGGVAEAKTELDDSAPLGSDRPQTGNEQIRGPALVDPAPVPRRERTGATEAVLIHAVQQILSPLGFGRVDHELQDGLAEDESIALTSGQPGRLTMQSKCMDNIG